MNKFRKTLNITYSGTNVIVGTETVLNQFHYIFIND